MEQGNEWRYRRNPRDKTDEFSTSGTVTIYFVAATAAFVLLTALLIDYARIAAFRKQAELSVKSGVRSSLSSYDSYVYERFGLFVRGGESAKELFQQTLEGNVAKQDDGIFPYLDVEWENADVTESRPLADHSVFRRQILEEMKYKAPIDLTIELASRFRGVSGGMKEAASTVDLLEAMRKAYEKRESALDEALAAQRNNGESIRNLLAPKVPSPSASQGRRSVGEVRTVADVADQYEDYASKRMEDEARREAQRLREEEKKSNQQNGEEVDEEDSEDEADGPRYGAIIAAYESGTMSLATTLSKDAETLRRMSLDSGKAARSAWTKAVQANDEMKAIAEKEKNLPQVSPIESTDEGNESISAEQIESMKQLRKTAEELILESKFFDDFASEIDLQMEKGDSLAGRTTSYANMISSIPGSTGRGQALKSETDVLQRQLSDYARDYGPGGSIMNRRESVLASHRSQDKERKQEEEKARSAWAGATNFLGSLTGISGSEEDKTAFGEVNGRYRSNLEWNKAEEEKAKTVRSNDPSVGRDEAISSSSGTMNALLGALSDGRNQLFFSEYTLSRLSHYDPSMVKKMVEGGETSLDIHLQEAEYILFGLNNPAGNIAAAYGEVFAFRLAIRTMEGLIECRSLGHPLLVLAAALVYGITNALLDLTRLVENGKVQLSKYLKVDTRYEDYIRLFLLVHGGSTNQTARMIALMEHATGLDFTGAYTYASGEGSASVRLWFFPGLLKTLGKLGHLGGSIKGNRYEATYTADSSYQ